MNKHVEECIEYVTHRRVEIMQNAQARILQGRRDNPERRRNYEKFKCVVCKLPHAEMFMVHDEVWALCNFPPESVVCFPCFLKAMPRPLVIEDFKQCLMNEMVFHAFAMGERACAKDFL